MIKYLLDTSVYTRFVKVVAGEIIHLTHDTNHREYDNNYNNIIRVNKCESDAVHRDYVHYIIPKFGYSSHGVFNLRNRRNVIIPDHVYTKNITFYKHHLMVNIFFLITYYIQYDS